MCMFPPSKGKTKAKKQKNKLKSFRGGEHIYVYLSLVLCTYIIIAKMEWAKPPSLSYQQTNFTSSKKCAQQPMQCNANKRFFVFSSIFSSVRSSSGSYVRVKDTCHFFSQLIIGVVQP